MKKVKIMLLSLALFAIVGGALAFKAKFTADYCTTTPVQGSCTVVADGTPLKCTTTAVKSAVDPNGPAFLCYTPTTITTSCTRTTCPTSEFLKDDQ